MRTTWVVVLAFFAIAAIAAGCGGDTSTGYKDVDLYGEETGGPGAAAPPPAGGIGESSLPPQDVSAPGWAPRVTVGGGRGGDELSKNEYESMKKIGGDYNAARKLYQEYFTKKEEGKEDKSSLSRAISLYDQLLTQLENMQKSHPDNHTIEEYFSNVSQERRNLLLEQ